MSDSRPVRRGVKIALLGAGVAAGAIGAAAYSANAAGSNGATASAYQAPANSSAPSGAPSGAPTGAPPSGTPGRPANHHGAAPVRSDEKAVSSTLAAKLKAAALEAVPGGTVYRVETDAGDATYEAHMTKADGTDVTVKFDKTGKVTAVEAGMGKGDPRPRH